MSAARVTAFAWMTTACCTRESPECSLPGWMPRSGDWVVTPRQGKPVEIQALWYNALRMMQDLAPDGGAHYKQLADRARRSFLPLFWNDAAGCLYDVVDGDRRDGSIRPNQIFADQPLSQDGASG